MGGSCCGNNLKVTEIQKEQMQEKKSQKENLKQFVELNFFKFLYQQCNKHEIGIKIPKTYTAIFGTSLPKMFYNNEEGFIKMAKVSETKILEDFGRFERKNTPFPAGVIRIFLGADQKQDVCFPLMTAKEVMKAWYFQIKSQVPCIFQKYIISKNQSNQILRSVYQAKLVNRKEEPQFLKILVVNNSKADQNIEILNQSCTEQIPIYEKTILAIQNQANKDQIYKLANQDQGKLMFIIPNPDNQREQKENTLCLQRESSCNYSQFEIDDFPEVDQALIQIKEVFDRVLFGES